MHIFQLLINYNIISESLTQGVVHTNGYDMIQDVSAIVASGGDDCPEYSAAGILKGMCTFYAFFIVCNLNQRIITCYPLF